MKKLIKLMIQFIQKSKLLIFIILFITLVGITIQVINSVNDPKLSYPAIFQGWATLLAFLYLIVDKISKADEDRQIFWRKNRPYLEVKPMITYSKQWNNHGYVDIKKNYSKALEKYNKGLKDEPNKDRQWELREIDNLKNQLEEAKYFKIQNCSDVSAYDIEVTICKGNTNNSLCLSHFVSSLRTGCDSETIYENSFVDPKTKMPKEGEFKFEEYLETCNENSNCRQLFIKLKFRAIPTCEMESKEFNSIFRVIFLKDGENLVVRNIIQEKCN